MAIAVRQPHIKEDQVIGFPQNQAVSRGEIGRVFKAEICPCAAFLLRLGDDRVVIDDKYAIQGHAKSGFLAFSRE